MSDVISPINRRDRGVCVAAVRTGRQLSSPEGTRRAPITTSVVAAYAAHNRLVLGKDGRLDDLLNARIRAHPS